MNKRLATKGVALGITFTALTGACSSQENAEVDPAIVPIESATVLGPPATTTARTEVAPSTTYPRIPFEPIAPRVAAEYSAAELEQKKIMQTYDFMFKTGKLVVTANGDAEVPFRGHQTVLPFEEIGDQGTLVPNRTTQANITDGACEIYYTTADIETQAKVEVTQNSPDAVLKVLTDSAINPRALQLCNVTTKPASAVFYVTAS